MRASLLLLLFVAIAPGCAVEPTALESQSLAGAATLGSVPYSGGVRFGVWAPNAERVFVAGTFNGWTPSANELKRQDGGVFAGEVTGAAVGDQYEYVIERAGVRLWRPDPQARELVENDQFKSVVADRAPYPGDGFSRPRPRDMVIYELHIPSFAGGDWVHATARLDQLADLGVNVLEVMPPLENPGTDGWGYGPVSLYAAEGGYGSPADVKDFVHAAHQRRMAVILDWVPNHMLDPNVLTDFDGTNLYFYPGSDGHTPWGPRPNYSSAGVRDYLTGSLRMWLGEYGFDGARVDSTIAMRKNDSGQDLPGAWSLMQEWNDVADREFPGSILIAEDLQGEPWLNKPTAEGGAGYDSQWDEEVYWALHDAVVTPWDGARDVARVAAALGHAHLGVATTRVLYTENHDKVPSDRQQRLPRAISPGSPEDYWALKRSTLAAGVLLTAPGIPMLFQGQECLETTGFDFPSPARVDWSRCDRFAGIRALYRDLIGLRRNAQGTSRGLTGNSLNVFHVNPGNHVIAYHRWDQGGPGDDVIVVANFSSQAFPVYEIGFPRGGLWRVRFNSDSSSYHASFANSPSFDTVAQPGGRDGLGYHGSIGVGPYSVVVLSQ